MLEPLHNLLKRHQGIDPSTLLATQICFYAQEAVRDMGLDEKECRVISYHRGRLKIAADNPTIAHRIKLKEEELVGKIRKRVHLKNSIKIFYTTQG